MRRMLDCFCGRFGWGRAFAARGWEVVGVDLVEPPEIPPGCKFSKVDILRLQYQLGIGFWFVDVPTGATITLGHFDFICASPPCEQFSKFGLKCFYPAPAYPQTGIQLFNHARYLCEAQGGAYVMENVRSAESFVGSAIDHCGPFYLWGNAVPPILPQGILKGRRLKRGGYKPQTGTKSDRAAAASVATIPPELSACVCDFAERLLEDAA